MGMTPSPLNNVKKLHFSLGMASLIDKSNFCSFQLYLMVMFMVMVMVMVMVRD